MLNINDAVSKVLNVEVMNLPIGKAVLLTSALGIAAGVSNAIDKMSGNRVPPLVTQLLVAGGMENIPAIKNFLGRDFTQLVSISALASGLNQQFGISGRIVGMLDKVTSMLPAVGSEEVSALPTTTTTPTTESSQAGLSGYDMGTYSQDSQTQALSNVDDIDLALLTARGYQTA